MCWHGPDPLPPQDRCMSMVRVSSPPRTRALSKASTTAWTSGGHSPAAVVVASAASCCCCCSSCSQIPTTTQPLSTQQAPVVADTGGATAVLRWRVCMNPNAQQQHTCCRGHRAPCRAPISPRLPVIKAHGRPRVDLLQLLHAVGVDCSYTLRCTWGLDHECGHSSHGPPRAIQQPAAMVYTTYNVELQVLEQLHGHCQ